MRIHRRTASLAFLLLALAWNIGDAQEYQSGIKWPEPPVVDPGPPGGPPADAVVLFDGKQLDAWEGGEKWKIADGVATASGGPITTKQAFGDCQLHVEWATPAKVQGSGQGRGNSGIYLMNQYEIQILDSHNNPTYVDGQAGALYKQHPPLVNASRPPGEWQVFDIIFTTPSFAENGEMKTPAYATVLQNGVLVQNHEPFTGRTAFDAPPKYFAHADKLPLHIQYHGDPVRFRNIWIRELTPLKPIE
jgi:hypothetical protein